MGAVVLVTLGVTTARSQSADANAALRGRLTQFAEKVVLPDRCNECHKEEYKVWEHTKHKTGFDELHKMDAAKQIYTKLGLAVIKRGTDESTPACLQCHYTPIVREGGLRAGAGVTCESCHGPARDWIDVHNNYGVQTSDFQQAARSETPQHKADRVARARAAGMRRPSDLYDVVANCFGCHTVPNEDLVNRGGHSTGTDLEVVAESQSPKLRHNFLDSFRTGDGKTNAERPIERRRMMYVVGRTTDLEYSLRAAALATAQDKFAAAVADRVARATDYVTEIVELARIPEIAAALETRNGVDIRINNRAPLVAAADRIREKTRAFVARANGADLADLDVLFAEPAPAASPRPGSPAGATPTASASAPTPTPPARQPAPSTAAAPLRGSPPETHPAPVAPTPTARVEASPATSPAAPATARPGKPAIEIAAPAAAAGSRRYPVNTRPAWREQPTHRFIASEPCSSCHNPQETWWAKDTHSGTVKAFQDKAQDFEKIAVAYGLPPGDMRKGNQICAWCHGTVLRSPALNVTSGVGCQRCHGPGLDYKEPHADENTPRAERYARSLSLGMTDLADPLVRARTCLGCHYITDAGLVAAGHTNGQNFNLVESLAKTRHWGTQFGRKTDDAASPGALATAQKNILAERGPAPQPEGVVAAARPPSPPAAPSASAATAPAAGGASEPAAAVPTVAASPAARDTSAPAPTQASPAGQPRPGPKPGAAVPAPVAAPPIPSVEAPPPPASAEPSVEEQLLQLKKRLEALYGKPKV